MADAWDILTAASVTGSFAVLCLVAVRVWSGLPNFMDRWLALKAARAAEKAADWTRMRDLIKDQGGEIKRINSRCTAVEEAEQKCREELVVTKADLADKELRIARLEGYQIGRGEAAQQVTILESTKRMTKEGKDDA